MNRSCMVGLPVLAACMLNLDCKGEEEKQPPPEKAPAEGPVHYRVSLHRAQPTGPNRPRCGRLRLLFPTRRCVVTGIQRHLP